MGVAGRVLLLALTLSGLTQAQPPQPSHVASGAGSSQWKNMSVKERLRHDARHVLDPQNILFAGMGAATDQWRDRPGQWGEGWGAYGHRYASHFSQYLIQRGIMFPVQAIDHEEPRYVRSKYRNYAARIGGAFLHTIWRRDDLGRMKPAYGEIFGDYAAAAVSRFWWPNQYHTASAIFIAGTDTVLIDGAINALHEFTPDLKRWFHIGHR